MEGRGAGGIAIDCHTRAMSMVTRSEIRAKERRGKGTISIAARWEYHEGALPAVREPRCDAIPKGCRQNMALRLDTQGARELLCVESSVYTICSHITH